MDILNIKTPNQQTSCVLFQTQGGSTLSQNRLEKTNYSKGSKGSEIFDWVYDCVLQCLEHQRNFGLLCFHGHSVWQCYINIENKNTIIINQSLSWYFITYTIESNTSCQVRQKVLEFLHWCSPSYFCYAFGNQVVGITSLEVSFHFVAFCLVHPEEGARQ